MQVCWINGIRMEYIGMDQMFDNQIVKSSKIGPFQPIASLCICVVVGLCDGY